MYENAELVKRSVQERRVPEVPKATILSATGSVINVPLCFWHDDRAAVNKCAECNRLVCVECMQSVGEVNSATTTTNHRTYCPLCAKAKQKSNKACQQALCCLAMLALVIIIITTSIKVFH
jgi:hypothetical protein